MNFADFAVSLEDFLGGEFGVPFEQIRVIEDGENVFWYLET